MNEYWLKYGFKENGNLVCVRTLSKTKPDNLFYYTENDETKEVKNSCVIKISKELINKVNKKI
jgi:hypothetical protein